MTTATRSADDADRLDTVLSGLKTLFETGKPLA